MSSPLGEGPTFQGVRCADFSIADPYVCTAQDASSRAALDAKQSREHPSKPSGGEDAYGVRGGLRAWNKQDLPAGRKHSCRRLRLAVSAVARRVLSEGSAATPRAGICLAR